MNKTTSAIETHNLSVAYGDEPVLWNVSIQILTGKMTAIVGPNGAGKSTLLEALLGFLKPLKGEINYFQNKSYKAVKDRVAYVPQKQAVDWNFPATVLEVVMMGRYGNVGLFKRLKQSDKNIALEKLEAVQMSDFADRQINELSGGQKQRVFLARALASEADIYLLDEPLAGVDMKTEKIIMSLLYDLTRQNKTVIVVHHDLQTVEEYFDQIVFLNQKVIEQGPVDQVYNQEQIEQTFRPSLAIEERSEDGRF